jgi:uncharacterized coiled-coil DUF342 family protein
LIGAAGAFFGARSYYLSVSTRKGKQNQKLKRMLVGSAETSVKNLTQVIDDLRVRIDRQNEKIEMLLDKRGAQNDRIEDLKEKRDELLEEINTLMKQNKRMVQQVSEKPRQKGSSSDRSMPPRSDEDE